jgi:hypothetical protein
VKSFQPQLFIVYVTLQPGKAQLQLVIYIYIGPVFTQPLTEMTIGTIKKKVMFLESKVRPVRGADNLIAIYEPIV